MADALGRLVYVADRQLFAVVTADAGCGKPTLIRKFASSLPKEDYILLYLSDSKLTPRWFYAGRLSQLGLGAKYYRSAAKRQLQKEIEIIRGVHNQKVVCVLDGYTGAVKPPVRRTGNRESGHEETGIFAAEPPSCR